MDIELTILGTPKEFAVMVGEFGGRFLALGGTGPVFEVIGDERNMPSDTNPIRAIFLIGQKLNKRVGLLLIVYLVIRPDCIFLP